MPASPCQSGVFTTDPGLGGKCLVQSAPEPRSHGQQRKEEWNDEERITKTVVTICVLLTLALLLLSCSTVPPSEGGS
jgi:hypothetical protein